jgi:hypothetical protein
MKPLRKLAAAAVFVALLLTVLFGVQLALVPHTVENGEEISNAFAASSNFIKSFQEANQRLPNEVEFESWKAQQKGASPRIASVKIIAANELPLDAQRLFGTPPANSFALSLWRGEWYEHYAAWAQKSTIDSPLWLYVVAIGLLSISAFSTVVLWKFARGGSPTRNTKVANE